MLIKCRTKSTRVKGLSFHPRLNFLLASMHSGEIQLWDYMNSAMVDVFNGHDGPVRGVDFHMVQPLFVSGGDDTKLIVWDFRQKKKLFKLSGHLDYIRTVQFHEKYPWIISSSDDQTIRIWNWQSRSCISVLSGHSHYVMSAFFHHDKDLVVSASLDHTARIWDISCLCEKTCSLKGISGVDNVLASVQIFNDGHRKSEFPLQMDVMNFTDVICKHTLTGHTKGVNWAIFHNDAPIVITASDDKTVRAWRYNNDTVWQTNILRGHQNNICSLIFHPNNVSYLLSVSEDHSIKVWDTNKWCISHTFMMDDDRFWIISKSRNSNYIAAGHDSGLIVFKLFKERPITCIHDGILYYAWNDTIYMQNLEKECNDYENELKNPDIKYKYYLSSSTNDNRIINDCDDYIITNNDLIFPSPSGNYCKTRKVVSCINSFIDVDKFAQNFINKILDIPDNNNMKLPIIPITLYCNTYNDNLSILILYNNKSQFYVDIINKIPIKGTMDYKIIFKTIQSLSCCFISKNSFISIDLDGKCYLYNLLGEQINTLNLTLHITKVYPICLNIILLWSQKDNKIILFNTYDNNILNEVHVPFGKIIGVYTSKSKQLIAVIFDKYIIIFDRYMNKLTLHQSNSKIKSAAWDENFSIIYTTSTHIYYLLISGSYGIIKSIQNPIYILTINNKILYLINRYHRCFKLPINSYDYSFKLALYINDINTANTLVNNNKIYSKSIVAHLINIQQPNLARKILHDHKHKFEISLQFKLLNLALEDAINIDDTVRL